MPLTPQQYSQALGEILSLDAKIKSMTPAKIKKRIAKAEKECERRPFGMPKRPVIFKVPLTAFIVTFLIFTALLIVFGITGMITKYFVLSYIIFIPLTFKNLVFSLFGNPLPLPGPITISNIRAWAAENNNLWFFGQVLLSFALIALAVAVIFIIVDIIKKSKEYKTTLENYPKTPEEYTAYEDKRQEEAQKKLDRVKREATNVGTYENRIVNLCNYIGLAPQYRYVNYIKAFKGYIDSGRAYTLADAINLHHTISYQNEQNRLANEANEHAKNAEYYAEKAYREQHYK